MSTQTPRTDAATFERHTTCATYRGVQTVVESLVTADFARELERELAAEREKVQTIERENVALKRQIEIDYWPLA